MVFLENLTTTAINALPTTGGRFVYDSDLNIVKFRDGTGTASLIVSDPTGNVNISTHNGTTTGLQLNGTLVTATGAELNLLDGVTATTAELNILDGVTATTAELNILDGVTATTAELNILDGVTATTAELNLLDGVTATTAELNYVDVTAGTAAASKALVLDASSNITGIGNLTATNLTGTLQTAAQSNITSLGTLTGLSVHGTSLLGNLATANSRMRVIESGGTIFLQVSSDENTGGAADLFVGNYFQTTSTSARKFMIKADGKVGIQTNAPDKQLEINSATGDCLRLTYNDSNGTATNYTDLIVTSGGTLHINPSSEFVNVNAALHIDHDRVDALQVRKDGNLGDVFTVDTVNDFVDINSHDGSAKGLKLGGTLVCATAAEINYNCDVVAGTAAASSTLVLDSNSDITGINEMTVTTLNVTNLNVGGGSSGIITQFAEGGLIINSFTNTDLNGRLFKQEIITDIDLNDYNPEGQTDNFSIEIIGYIQPQYTETYTFHLTTNTGVRLWVNDQLLYNDWTGGSIDASSTTIALTAGEWYPFRIHHTHTTGIQDLLVQWSSATEIKANIPSTRMAWDNTNNQITVNPTHIADSLTLFSSTNDNAEVASISINTAGVLYINATGTPAATVHNGRFIVDETNIEALLVRKDEDGGDIFKIDTTNSQVEASNGTAALPAYSFISDPNTGIYRIAENTIGFATAGTERMSIQDGHIQFEKHLRAFKGNASFAAYSFINDTNTGMHSSGVDTLNLCTAGSDRLIINSSGNIGIGTSGPDKQLEINSATGDCLRLTYNDSDGSATNYVDLITQSNGNFTISPSGGATLHQGYLVIDDTNIEALLVRKDGNGGDVFIVDTTNERVGIGIAPTVKLHIRNTSVDTVNTVLLLDSNDSTNGSGLSLDYANVLGGSTVTGRINNIRHGSGDYSLSFLTYNGSLSEHMVLRNGRMGIGTNDPDQKVEILESTGPQLRLTNTDAIDYVDFEVSTAGQLDITLGQATQNIVFQNKTQVHKTDINAFRVYDDSTNIAFNVDSTNKRVGIGEATPDEMLHITSTGAVKIKLEADTNDGVGEESENVGIILSQDNGLHTGYIGLEGEANQTITGSTANTLLLATNGTTAREIEFATDNTIRMTIDTTGNVGIGTTGPDKVLEINSATGDCLRLTYNDSNGSATNYADLTLNSGGRLIFTPSGGISQNIGLFSVTATHVNAFLVENTGGTDIFKVDTSSEFVDILTHDGSTKGLKLGGTLVCATAAEINVLCDVTPGTAANSKALVLDSSGNVGTINELTATTINTTNINISGLMTNFAEGGLIINSLSTNNMNGNLVKQELLTDIDLTDYNPAGLTDNFSIEIIGYIKPQYTETYTFHITANDKIRFWVNDTILYHDWSDATKTDVSSTTIALTAGIWYPIRIHHEEITLTQRLLIQWSSTSEIKANIPAARMAWDNTENQININPVHISDSMTLFNSSSTAAQTAKFEVSSTGELGIIPSGTNVGIGTTAPGEILDIQKSGADNYIRVQAGGTTTNYSGILLTEHNIYWGWHMRFDANTDKLHIGKQNTTPTFTDAITIINTSYNVGIGTSAPDKQLEINSATGDNLRLTYNDNNGSATNYCDFLMTGVGTLRINPTNNKVIVGGVVQGSNGTAGAPTFSFENDTNSGMYSIGDNIVGFSTAGVEKVRLDATGQVGIGTSAPAKKLEVRIVADSGDGIRVSDGVDSADITLDTFGDLDITASTGHTKVNSKLTIDHTDIEAFQVRKDGNTGDILSVDSTNSQLKLVDGTAALPAYTFISDPNTGMRRSGTDQLSLCTAGSDRITINSIGQVGINTTNPDKILELNSSVGACLRLTYNDNNGSATNYTDFELTSGGNLVVTGSNTNPTYTFTGAGTGRSIIEIESTGGVDKVHQELVFKSHSAARGGGITWNTNSTTRTFLGRTYNGGGSITSLRYNVDTSGINDTFDNSNTLLQIDDSTGKLHTFCSTQNIANFNNSTVAQGAYIEVNNQAGTRALFGADGTGFAGGATTNVVIGNWSNGDLDLATNGVIRATLDTTGDFSAVTLTETSDIRVKENIIPANIEESYEKINQIQLKDYNFINNPDITHRGVIAQEIKEIIPNAVKIKNHAGYEDFHTISNKELVGFLIGAVQYLSKKVEELEKK